LCLLEVGIFQEDGVKILSKSSSKIQAVRGFKDWLPEDFIKYEYLIETAKEILKNYNYKEIKIPILEKTELFIRSIGEVTDIVQKETYTFQDRNKDFLTLRPEATAGICRMIIENGLFTRPKPLKFFTIGPMFRHERPQKGRLREFFQIDVEFFGNLNPYYEAELIYMALLILNKPLDKQEKSPFILEINSLGCERCRPKFREYLIDALNNVKEKLCNVCQERLERNPLRILDCKNEVCKEEVQKLKPISEFWCKECKEHFEELKKVLNDLKIEYTINPYLVRGLDYYIRTIFEIKAKELGAQDTVCAGGRYDKLLSELGGPELPAIGFAIGLERWSLCVFNNQKERELLEKNKPEIFVAILGKEQFPFGIKLVQDLRKEGFKTETNYEEKKLKALLREADKLSVKKVLILGEDEYKAGKILLKDMETGAQEEIALNQIIEKLKETHV